MWIPGPRHRPADRRPRHPSPSDATLSLTRLLHHRRLQMCPRPLRRRPLRWHRRCPRPPEACCPRCRRTRSRAAAVLSRWCRQRTAASWVRPTVVARPTVVRRVLVAPSPPDCWLPRSHRRLPRPLARRRRRAAGAMHRSTPALHLSRRRRRCRRLHHPQSPQRRRCPLPWLASSLRLRASHRRPGPPLSTSPCRPPRLLDRRLHRPPRQDRLS